MTTNNDMETVTEDTPPDIMENVDIRPPETATLVERLESARTAVDDALMSVGRTDADVSSAIEAEKAAQDRLASVLGQKTAAATSSRTAREEATFAIDGQISVLQELKTDLA